MGVPFPKSKRIMISIFSGLLAGAVHVWSGPDHLTAIAPLAVRRPQRAWVPGARWGLGHSAGVGVIGLLSLTLREWLPVDLLSSWGERCVGVMLFGIGLWALRRAIKHNVHAHEHEHDGEKHVHLHTHRHQHAKHHERVEAHHHSHAPFGIGILHGLAGSSHFLGILPSLALPSRTQAVAYLLAFGIGTVVSMATFSWVLGTVTKRFAVGSVKVYRGLLGSCALLAMAVGAFWLATSWR